MAQVGRIGGHLLKDQLVRDGIDLSFKNEIYDSTPILFLDVSENKIGIKTDAPLYDLDIRTDIKSTNIEATSIAEIDNIRMIAPNTISTKIGPLYLTPEQNGAYFFMNRMQSDDLDFNDNTISGLSSNQNIEFRPAGTGTTELQSNVNVYGTLGVTSDITLDGNVTLKGNITLGDETTVDTITIKPQFAQNLNPGTDNTLDIGSPTNRWTTVFTPDLTQVDNVNPGAVKVSDQTWIDGIGMKIQGLQSDDDIILTTVEVFDEISNPQGADNEDEFGLKSTDSNSFIAIAAPSEDSTLSNQGVVYLYNHDNNLQRAISHPSPATGDRFGSAIGLASDDSYLAVGAWNQGLDEGVVYIFDPADGSLQHTISNPDTDPTTPTDNFGNEVVAKTDYLYISSPSADNTVTYPQAGAVYVYNPSTGSQVQYILNPVSSLDSTFFGRGITANSTHLFIGANYRVGTDKGRIYAYNKSTWTVDYEIADPVSDSTGLFSFNNSANDTYLISQHDTADSIYVFDASNGSLLRTITVTGQVLSNGVGAKLAGNDFIVVPTTSDIQIYRASTGVLVSTYDSTQGINGADSVTPIESGRRFIRYKSNLYNLVILKTTKFTLDIEDINIRENYFENQLNTPVQLRNTGIGYVKFEGTNAIIIPYGPDADRPPNPELGDTRWNSDESYLESFAGEVNNVSLTSATLTGIPDQITFVTAATNNRGTGVELQINIISESIVSTTITEVGAGYQQGDTLTISGNQLSGGSTPTNDITFTVGAQDKDGYVIATGGGEEVTQDIMDDLGVIYSLILA